MAEDLQKRILQVLEEINQPLLAREIASFLNKQTIDPLKKLKRRDVNSLLYGKLGGIGKVKKCHDTHPTWTLPYKKGISKEDLLKSDLNILNPPVSRLTIKHLNESSINQVGDLVDALKRQKDFLNNLTINAVVTIASVLKLHGPALEESYTKIFDSRLRVLSSTPVVEQPLMAEREMRIKSSLSANPEPSKVDKQNQVENKLNEIELQLLKGILLKEIGL